MQTKFCAMVAGWAAWTKPENKNRFCCLNYLTLQMYGSFRLENTYTHFVFLVIGLVYSNSQGMLINPKYNSQGKQDCCNVDILCPFQNKKFLRVNNIDSILKLKWKNINILLEIVRCCTFYTVCSINKEIKWKIQWGVMNKDISYLK